MQLSTEAVGDENEDLAHERIQLKRKRHCSRPGTGGVVKVKHGSAVGYEAYKIPPKRIRRYLASTWAKSQS